ncbi:hypothetical protein GCM10009528_43010 [Kineococcus aurantiacus]
MLQPTVNNGAMARKTGANVPVGRASRGPTPEGRTKSLDRVTLLVIDNMGVYSRNVS